MLFIYGALSVGGIETFFVRIAKERANLGLNTAILLLSTPERSDVTLLREINKYAKVYFPKDIFAIMPLIAKRFPLLAPIKKNRLHDLFENVDQVHVYHGMHALLGYRLSKIFGKNIPITIGFYHYIKYLWGGDSVAHFEKVNRQFVFNYLPKESLLFFSEGNRQLYAKNKALNFEKSQVFRLGVVDKKDIKISGCLNPPLKIVAVGRLVEFKTYNFYMLEVLQNLKSKGISFQFDIYGDGPLKEKINEKISQLELDGNITLKGALSYLEFDKMVYQYDLFIGSGTAIIQAASLGVPSIVGVENVIQPKTYGYFSDVHQYEYNLKGLSLPFLSVQSIIENYISMDKIERMALKKAHLESIEEFTNESCQVSMDALKNIKMPDRSFSYNRWVYEFSRVLDKINMKVNKNHPRLTQFKDFKKISES